MRARHLTRAAAIAAATLLLASCGEDGPGLVVPHPDTTDVPATAAGTYRAQCSGCHALDGRPLASGVDDLRGYSASYEQFDSVMSAGPGLMPRFPQIDQQGRRALYDHIRTFRR